MVTSHQGNRTPLTWERLGFHVDHVADLEKSGLEPDWVAGWQVQSVFKKAHVSAWLRKHQLHGARIRSLLLFPYPEEPDGFERAKIFPSLKTDTGGTLRYLQPKGSGSRLYVPFERSILEEPEAILRITEGEKKALKSSQEGLNCTALGGLWNFRTKDGQLIPALQNLKLSGRAVELIPDGEVWANRPDLLKPIFQLAQLLADQGAKVQFVQLPTAAGQDKLDDFLVHHGVDGKAAYQALTRVTIEDKAFRFIRHSEDRKNRSGKTYTVEHGAKILDEIVQEAQVDAGQAYQRLIRESHLIALVFEKDLAYCEEQFLALIEAGTTKTQITDLKKILRQQNCDAKKQRQYARTAGQGNGRLVREAIADAPVTRDARIPPGWQLSPKGVAQAGAADSEDGVEEIVISTPAFLTARLKDVTAGTESVRLTYLRDQAWQHHTTDRRTIAESRKITELASFGCPVSSNTASAAVRYFADYERTNLDAIPLASVSRQMGWIQKGKQFSFLVGKSQITPGQPAHVEIDLETLPPEDWKEDFIAFHADCDGGQQLAEGFHTAGTFEEWAKAAALAVPYPRVILAVYASLAAPLLSILGAPNFSIDWCGYTSQGKTSTLRLAASVWGCPDERQSASTLFTWDTTRVWIERASALLHSLPIILDDTKKVKYPKMVAQTIYDISNGRGRGRGSPSGMQRSGTWATIGLFSGEQPAVSFSEDGGTRTRVLTLHGLPFAMATKKTANVVRNMTSGLTRNYGHAGLQFVRYLVDNQQEWESWRQLYQADLLEFREKAGTDPIADRLSGYFATLNVAAGIAHAALNLPWAYANPIASLWSELVGQAQEADRGRRALELVVSWASSNEARFYPRMDCDRENNPKRPALGWAGTWPEDNTHIAFYPHVLEDLLKKWELQPVDIYEQWKSKGWLKIEKGRRGYQGQFRKDGIRERGIILNQAALETLGVGDTAEE